MKPAMRLNGLNHLVRRPEGDQQLALVGDLLAGKTDLQILDRLGMQSSLTPAPPRPAGWSSGVLPMPPQENTTSPAAIVRLNRLRQALAVVTRYSTQLRRRPRAPSISAIFAKCRSCRLPDRISSPR